MMDAFKSEILSDYWFWISLALLSLWWLIAVRQRNARLSLAATDQLLSARDEVEPGCASISKALNSYEKSSQEWVCAEQMREIVLERHLDYQRLVDDPESLLQASRHTTSDNGALYTRFTVQYNLYAGSIVALGSNEQRQALFATQSEGSLGCFAFTEIGAGVLSGAGVETTATYDPKTDEFEIHSATKTAKKTWISQGCYAEYAVILANLIVDGEAKGPHLFWSRIAKRVEKSKRKLSESEAPFSLKHANGVTVSSLPAKTALEGLDNAFIEFNRFRVPRDALLSRFASVSSDGEHTLSLPKGTKRMLDLLVARLLTGRVVLSEYTTAYAQMLLQRAWKYASKRELWRGRKPRGKMMNQMPLVQAAFSDYAQCLAVVANFIAVARKQAAQCIKIDRFTPDAVEKACISKFVGTSLGVDVVSVTRKTLTSKGLDADMWLGSSSFVCNATCAAEGDNTIMELKVLQDVIRRRTSLLPLPLSALPGLLFQPHLLLLVAKYCLSLGMASCKGKKALADGQGLRDLAWMRAHLMIIQEWRAQGRDPAFLGAYIRRMVRFPTPICH